MKPSRNILFVEALQATLYDESGVMCYTYGNMGEVTQETRIYALPFLSSPVALSTQFTYDSWGRIQSITYPDNEVVSYGYDLGGQLRSITNNSNYTYLDNVTYDRFGAKVSQMFGNGIATDYSYHNLTRRLTDIIISDGTAISYTYDPVGNVTQVAGSYSWMQGQNLTETFTYDASDQLTTASETQFQSYLLDVTYGNWGKISDYDLTRTDFFNGAITQESRSFAYPSDPSGVQEAQTMFAPESQTGTTDAQFTFGINGSLRRVETHSPEHNLEHYLFNSAANLKAYSSEAMDFAYYGYNASNARTYKLSLSGTYQWHNGQQLQLSLQPQLSMFYPNAYINFNGNGEYTKHYYSGSERIASRLGNANTDITVTANARLTSRSTQSASRFQDDIRELMSDNSTVCPPSGISVNSLHQTGTSDIYYYHTNHLGSTAFVTDQNQNVTQGFLYAPFGEITTEYNATFGNDIIPKYSFNAKELDEETGMYYYEARYYKPPVFTSRDPMFEKYFWMSPYAYCANNPVKYVDPSGMILDIADNDETKNDLKSIVKEENRDRVVIDGIHVSVNTEGLSDEDLKNDIGLSLILDLCNSEKKFLFETSDFAVTLDENGSPYVGVLNTVFSNGLGGIINASNYGKDSRNGYTERPIKGYDGQVILSKSGTWYSKDGKEIRESVVFHELAENYYRTHYNYNYNGKGFIVKRYSAHSEAVFREPKNYFNNCMPGTGRFEGFTLTPQQKEEYRLFHQKHMGF